VWSEAGRALVEKMVAEWAYEELLAPVAEPGGGYALALPGAPPYRFAARRGGCGTWRVEPGSVTRGGEPADDPLRLLLDARTALGLSGPVAGEAVRELAATHAADARLLAGALPAAELADLGQAELEGYQTGHPCMVLSKGRLGFSAADAARYAPEARATLRLRWAAVAPGLGVAAGDPPPSPARPAPDGWVALPVHPWHWDECVEPLFAGELARGRIVPLGEGPDRYRPMQSIRTLTNVDAPARHDVKLPLLIRNTLVWRGLAPGPTAAAPAVTEWVRRLRDHDPFLVATGVVLQGEVASVAVRHPVFEELADAPYRYHELLGAVWREPVAAALGSGERARTMAALLQVGREGRALVAELVARSGLDARAWLQRLLRALLPPLLHYLYRYGLSFCPHGENTTVIFRDDVPVRIAVKDFAEDINLSVPAMPEAADVPPDVEKVLLRWEPSELCHSILSAIVAGHFRHFSGVVEDHLGVPENEFWSLVRAEVLAYQQRFPGQADRYERFDLLAPRFGRVCLNREHLLGGGFHDRAERDEGFDLIVGTVENPLARC
jgi:siderophore synthetase component